MGERLSGRDIDKLLFGAAPERSARGGNPEPGHLVGTLAEQALIDCPVLRIDGHERTRRTRLRGESVCTPLRIDLSGQRHDKIAAYHQRFLVRKRKHLARAERLVARAQPCRAHKRVHHNVRLGKPNEVDDRILAESQRCRAFGIACERQMRRQRSGGRRFAKVLVAHRRMENAELANLRLEHVNTRPERQTDHFEPIGVPPHHVERLASDGPRRTENDDALPGRHMACTFPRRGSAAHPYAGLKRQTEYSPRQPAVSQTSPRRGTANRYGRASLRGPA